jgi:hypothetical protein
MYESEWARYRTLRNRSIWMWLAYIPVVGAFALLAGFIYEPAMPWAAMVSAFAWMLLWIYACMQFGQFACPRCKKAFAATSWFHLGIAKRCVHCSLPKYATD